tara:strand:- start:1149 stop:1490 length:342 start_codon:yes stop_codon:yes gene_type:complete
MNRSEKSQLIQKVQINYMINEMWNDDEIMNIPNLSIKDLREICEEIDDLQFEMTLEEAKEDISSFIRNNDVVVKCFVDLQDYCDANMYVAMDVLDLDKANNRIDKLDNFIKTI